jgi:hypothetical protein
VVEYLEGAFDGVGDGPCFATPEVLSAVAVYTVVFVSRSMLGCRKKGLRAPTCAVAFLILDLTSVSSRRSVHQKLMENVPK